jgi:hypothetical protein
LGVDSKISGVSSEIYPYEKYDPIDGRLSVCIISYAAGATNQTRVEDTNNGGFDIHGTSQFNLSMSLTGLNRTEMEVMLDNSADCAGAVNLTFPHTKTIGSTAEYPINQSLEAALGLVPGIGYFASAASLASTLTSY